MKKYGCHHFQNTQCASCRNNIFCIHMYFLAFILKNKKRFTVISHLNNNARVQHVVAYKGEERCTLIG